MENFWCCFPETVHINVLPLSEPSPFLPGDWGHLLALALYSLCLACKRPQFMGRRDSNGKPLTLKSYHDLSCTIGLQFLTWLFCDIFAYRAEIGWCSVPASLNFWHSCWLFSVCYSLSSPDVSAHEPPSHSACFFWKAKPWFCLVMEDSIRMWRIPIFLWKDSSGFGILPWLDVVTAQLLLQSWLWQSLCDFCSASLGALLCVPETGIWAGANPTGMVLGIRSRSLSLCLTDAACSLHSQGTLMF